MNPAEQFLNKIDSTLQLLSKLPDISVKQSDVFVQASYCPRPEELILYISVSWSADVDFRSCSENRLTRWLCKLAHGNECGSGRFAILRRTLRESNQEILRCFQEVDLEEMQEPYQSIETGRQCFRLFIFVKARMSSEHLSQEVRGAIKTTPSQSEEIKYAREIYVEYPTESGEKSSFTTCLEALYKELGIGKYCKHLRLSMRVSCR